MSDTGGRRSRRQPAAPVGSPARGAVLIVVAVAVGFLLIGTGLDDDGAGGPVDAGSGGTTSTTAETTSTTEAARPVNEVKVLVANGSGVDGAAGRFTDTLNAAGYATGNPVNAERVESTIVHYTEGFDREAVAVAEAIGSNSAAVQALGPPPAPVDDAQGANVIVVVGPDIAAG